MISFAELTARIRAFLKFRDLDRDFEQEFEAHLVMLWKQQGPDRRRDSSPAVDLVR